MTMLSSSSNELSWPAISTRSYTINRLRGARDIALGMIIYSRSTVVVAGDILNSPNIYFDILYTANLTLVHFVLLCIIQIELSVGNIDQILTTLTYDGKVEATVQLMTAENQVKLYRVANHFLSTTGMVYTPCGVCPVNFKNNYLIIVTTLCFQLGDFTVSRWCCNITEYL